MPNQQFVQQTKANANLALQSAYASQKVRAQIEAIQKTLDVDPDAVYRLAYLSGGVLRYQRAMVTYKDPEGGFDRYGMIERLNNSQMLLTEQERFSTLLSKLHDRVSSDSETDSLKYALDALIRLRADAASFFNNPDLAPQDKARIVFLMRAASNVLDCLDLQKPLSELLERMAELEVCQADIHEHAKDLGAEDHKLLVAGNALLIGGVVGELATIALSVLVMTAVISMAPVGAVLIGSMAVLGGVSLLTGFVMSESARDQGFARSAQCFFSNAKQSDEYQECLEQRFKVSA